MEVATEGFQVALCLPKVQLQSSGDSDSQINLWESRELVRGTFRIQQTNKQCMFSGLQALSQITRITNFYGRSNMSPKMHCHCMSESIEFEAGRMYMQYPIRRELLCRCNVLCWYDVTFKSLRISRDDSGKIRKVGLAFQV